MPVLEGLSGAGKSSALAILGGPWYKAAPQAFGSKEFLEAIQGAWLTEIPDMVGFGRREHTQIIAAITTRADPYRAAYGRVCEDHPRTTIFAATSETDSYLDDDRGKRRYWPLRCTEIRLDVLRSIRDQLFAEATAQFTAGSTWHEVPAEESEQEQLARRIADPWEDAISYYVKGRVEVEMSRLLTDGLALEYARQDRSAQMRAAKVLKTLGFDCKVVWDNGRSVRRYLCRP
jgi:putative DNA primase/helicase